MISCSVCSFTYVQCLKKPDGCPVLRTNEYLQQSFLAEDGNPSAHMTLIFSHIQLRRSRGANLNYPQITPSL